MRTLSWFATLLFAAVALCSPAIAQQQFKLGSIRVSGSQEFREADIVRASGLISGDLAGPADFENAANRLSSTGAFAAVNFTYGPEGSGIGVEFKVEDNPEFLPVRYENFVWADDESLNAEVAKRVPLFQGRVTQAGDMAQNVAEALTEWLHSRGINGETAFRLHSKGVNEIPDALSFFVQGVPMTVRSAALQGALTLSPEEREQVTRPLLGMDYESGLVHDATMYRSIPIYQKRGYLRASIGHPQVKVIGQDPTHPELAVVIPVSEGLQYSLGNLEISGNRVLSISELLYVVRSKPQAVADGELLRGDADAIHKLYSARGYLAASVNPDLKFDDELKAVAAILRVKEGPLFRMGRLEIIRKDGKSTDKLLKAWKLRPGDTYIGEYPMQFLKANAAETVGHNVNIVQTNGDGNTVNIRIEF